MLSIRSMIVTITITSQHRRKQTRPSSRSRHLSKDPSPHRTGPTASPAVRTPTPFEPQVASPVKVATIKTKPPTPSRAPPLFHQTTIHELHTTRDPSTFLREHNHAALISQHANTHRRTCTVVLELFIRSRPTQPEFPRLSQSLMEWAEFGPGVPQPGGRSSLLRRCSRHCFDRG